MCAGIASLTHNETCTTVDINKKNTFQGRHTDNMTTYVISYIAIILYR